VPPRRIAVSVDLAECGKDLPGETLLVSEKNHHIRNVVLRLEGVEGASENGAKQVEIINKGCTFVPHVAVATVGDTLVFSNQDDVLHSMHPYLNEKNFFNVPLPPKSKTPRGRPIIEPGLIKVGCDIHSWMQSYVVVGSNRFIAVTDAEGRIEMTDIPPGKYTYVAWHESLGEKRGSVTIMEGKSSPIRLEFEEEKSSATRLDFQ